MLQCYDFVKCESCGLPWDEHDSSCANHLNRDARIAGQATLSEHDKLVLKKGGWTPPDEQDQIQTIQAKTLLQQIAKYVDAVILSSAASSRSRPLLYPSLGSPPEIQTVFQGDTALNGHGRLK